MSRCVKLSRLPDGLVFPAPLSERVSYDSARQELHFVGFMSKTDFDKLVRLSNDIAYQRALERLFQICTFDEPKPRRVPVPLILAGGAAVVVTLGVVAFLAMHH